MATKTNKTNRRRRTHHPAVTIIVIILLIGILIFISKMLVNHASDGDSDNNKKETSVTTEVEPTNKTSSEEEILSDDSENTKTPAQNEGENPNTKESLTGALTMAEITDQTLHIRVNIDQYLSSGTCKLTMTSNFGTSFTDSAAIIPVASTSTCEGFDYPVSNFASGYWRINIDLETADKTGNITGEINL